MLKDYIRLECECNMDKQEKTNRRQTKKEGNPKAKSSGSATKASAGKKTSAIQAVRLRNGFYRDSYRFLLIILLGLMILTGIMVAMVIYLQTHKPLPKFFAANMQGGLAELVPLSKPKLSDAEVINWAARAAVATWSINYVEYRRQLEETKNTYFTAQGGERFLKTWAQSQNLNFITRNAYIATATFTQAPAITSEGLIRKGKLKGRYAWLVEIPLLISFRNQSGNNTRSNVTVRLTIVRTSILVDNLARKMNLDSLMGIGVDNYVIITPLRIPVNPNAA